MLPLAASHAKNLFVQNRGRSNHFPPYVCRIQKFSRLRHMGWVQPIFQPVAQNPKVSAGKRYNVRFSHFEPPSHQHSLLRIILLADYALVKFDHISTRNVVWSKTRHSYGVISAMPIQCLRLMYLYGRATVVATTLEIKPQ